MLLKKVSPPQLMPDIQRGVPPHSDGRLGPGAGWRGAGNWKGELEFRSGKAGSTVLAVLLVSDPDWINRAQSSADEKIAKQKPESKMRDNLLNILNPLVYYLTHYSEATVSIYFNQGRVEIVPFSKLQTTYSRRKRIPGPARLVEDVID